MIETAMRELRIALGATQVDIVPSNGTHSDEQSSA
jgi:hypothetical protein